MSDLISRMEVLNWLYSVWDGQITSLFPGINSLPSAEKAQPSEEDATKDATSDLISKKEATTIPVMPKEHREYQTMNLDDAYEQGWFDYQKCIEELPSAGGCKCPCEYREPCDYCHYDAYREHGCPAAVERLKELPSAEPERKKGKWQWCGNHHLCSECDEWALTRWNEDECDEVDILTDFCPNCGADMRGEE